MTAVIEASARVGASPEEWTHFATRLGLASDLLPVVSNPKATISQNSTLKDLGKVPSHYNGHRHAVGFSGWTQHHSTQEEIAQWSSEEDFGICLATRRIRAIDVDVTDPKLSDEVLSAIEGAGFHLPKRYRANSSKFLLAFDMPGDFGKRRFQCKGGNDKDAVEFLAGGQQFIAVGTHPSGVRYEWDGGLPDHFPILSAQQFEALWSALVEEFSVPESATIGKGSVKQQKLADALTNDPVAQHLLDKGWVKRIDRSQRVDITCPFENGHSTDSSDSATSYFPRNTGGYANGHFFCQHQSCKHRTDEDFKGAIGYEDDIAADFEDLTAKANTARENIESKVNLLRMIGLLDDETLSGIRQEMRDADFNQSEFDEVVGQIAVATKEQEDRVRGLLALEHLDKAGFQEYTLNLANLRPVEFSVDGFLGNGLTVIAGPPGVGKTSLITPLAAAVAHLYASGLPVELRRRVIYVSEAPEQVERTLYGLLKHAPGASQPSEFKDRFRVFPSRRLSHERLGGFIKAMVAKHSVDCNGYAVAPLIVLDTSNATIDLENENDNAEVGRAIAAIKQNLGNGACWLVAHTAKALRRADVDDMDARGAGAFAGDANATAFVFEERDIPEQRFMAVRKRRFEASFTELAFSTQTHQEEVTTPWGTKQAITYRIGMPEASHRATREAARQKARVERDEKRISSDREDIRKYVVRYLESVGPSSKNSIEKAVPKRAENVRAVLTHMVEDNELQLIPGGRGGGALYALVKEDLAVPAGADVL